MDKQKLGTSRHISILKNALPHVALVHFSSVNDNDCSEQAVKQLFEKEYINQKQDLEEVDYSFSMNSSP